MANWDSYRDDLDTLKSELEYLIEARNDVMRRIKIAEEQRQQLMKPTTEVQLWLSSVQAVETEVDGLIKQASEEIEKFHPGGFCSRTFNMSSSYEFKDTVADKLPAVTNLINEGAFLVADEVRVVTTLKDEGAPEAVVPETIPEDDQWPIVGMEWIFEKVWKCLKKGGGGGDDDDYDYDYEEEEEEEDVGIIGVYGMGGVGKTTLLKQINKKLLQMKNDFDVVIWVVVSRDLQLDKIQKQIGEKIGLFDNKAWEHMNFEEKASDIFKILEEKKFVLLMDDLWERVDLTKVGVPLPSPENSSKIVFTTRSLQICSLMEADRQFKINCLGDGEAWKLFEASVGDETLQCHPVVKLYNYHVRGVCRECCGLPLALVSIGRAMASKKTLQEWSDVFKVLRRSMTSYSDYWIGEGFLDDRLGAVQSQGHYIIDVLLSVCLLGKHGEDDSSVKMHYWIHDMSLWIASKIEMEKGNCFFCTDLPCNLTEAQVTEILVKATRMSLQNEDVIENLSDAPKCPHLQTLFLVDSSLEVISNNFFQFMPSLKVLNLSGNYLLTKLPRGISNLISLQHLDLSNTEIRELPKDFRALKKLKCLNLESTYNLRTIPRQLISKFSVLHVLRLWECGFMLRSTEKNVEFNDAQLLIEELLCLKNLSMLRISLKNSHALQRLLSSNRLQSCIQSLCLRDLSHPKSIKVSLTDLKHLNTLEISEWTIWRSWRLILGLLGKSKPYENLLVVFTYLVK
ncbi:hypothetical protein LWI28_000550 [Acer negundo]|uniref:AAA+ ATPase domain-containing protein n=1 Tax=Acer negundo TaxID=4023 RepID=A0AAD5J2H1_ACENE|nr:hypothetical protein LWI28_000550 [Acer negundo]